MPTGSLSTTSQSSSNPVLTNMFTQLFGGQQGAGATGTGALMNIAKGTNITDLNKALTTNWQQTSNAGAANIKEAFGSSGMGHSSSMLKGLSQYWTQQQGQLTSQIASADQTAQGQTLQAASYLSQMFSGAANNYFSSGSSSSSFDPALWTKILLG